MLSRNWKHNGTCYAYSCTEQAAADMSCKIVHKAILPPSGLYFSSVPRTWKGRQGTFPGAPFKIVGYEVRSLTSVDSRTFYESILRSACLFVVPRDNALDVDHVSRETATARCKLWCMTTSPHELHTLLSHIQRRKDAMAVPMRDLYEGHKQLKHRRL